MIIQERLKVLQEWAITGIRIVKLPSVNEFGSEESELALLQYCYYRLIYHVAGNILADRPNYAIHELVELLLSSPMGCGVTKECIVSLCKVFMLSDLRKYCRGRLFGNWTADDVAGVISSENCDLTQLLKAALNDNFATQKVSNQHISGVVVTQVQGSSTYIGKTKNTTLSIQDLFFNPIFQLSLSSKELFHSNFLLWLAYNHTDIFNYILRNCFKAKFDFDPTKHIALREFMNLDFCICEKLKNVVDSVENISTDEAQEEVGRILFVLENKFKSLPYLTQLENYETKVLIHNAGNKPIKKKNETVSQYAKRLDAYYKELDNVHFVLLTLTKELPWMNIQNGLVRNRWVHVTYNEYATAFDCLPIFSSGMDPFVVELIKRYQDFIMVFSDYMANNIPCAHQLSKKGDWTIMSSNQIMKKLRTDDIWQKLVASSIASLIELRLKQNGINGVFNNLGVKELLAPANNNINSVPSCTIYISIGFSRGTALIDVKRKIDNNVIYGVQIQNGYYKRVLESVNSIVTKVGHLKLFTNALNSGLFNSKFDYKPCTWIDSNPNIFVTPQVIHPSSNHVCKAGLKGFGGYGLTFVCQSKVIDTNSSISDVVNAIVDDIKL